MPEHDDWTPPLLRGEPSDVAQADRLEAKRWADAYARLVWFEESILERMQTLADRVEPDLRPIIEVSNIQPLAELIETFRSRADAWRRQVADLESG